jgi:DNA-binding FadR family transcriptional regulator
VRERMMELITKSLLLREGMQQAVQQHSKILEAFRSGSPAKAREAVRLHLASFQRGYKVLQEESRRSHSA